MNKDDLYNNHKLTLYYENVYKKFTRCQLILFIKKD